MTREAALLARVAPLLEVFARNSVPTFVLREFEEVRAEVKEFIRERSVGADVPPAVIVNVYVVPTGEGTAGTAADGAILGAREKDAVGICPDCNGAKGGCVGCHGASVVMTQGSSDYRALTLEEATARDLNWRPSEDFKPKKVCKQCGGGGMVTLPRRYLGDREERQVPCGECADGLGRERLEARRARVAAGGGQADGGLPDGFDQGAAAKASWNKMIEGVQQVWQADTELKRQQEAGGG